MAIQKHKKPIMPFMVDIETLSLDRRAAIIDIAIAPVGEGSHAKRWLINPESYKPDEGFDINPETVAFHANQKTNLVEHATIVGQSWQSVAREFYDYFLLQGAYEVHMWSQGKDFDFPVLEFFLKQAGLKTPWKYTHTHCLRDLSQQYPEVKRGWYGNHTSMQDTLAQVSHLKNLCAYSDRVYKFVYGEA